MSQLRRKFTTIRIIIIAIYSSVYIYTMLVYLGIPSISYVWGQTQQMIFFVLLAMIPPVFIASALIGKRMLSPEKLMEKFHSAGGGEAGLKTAISLALSGAVIMAAMGEACAIYGLVLYFLSGDTARPMIFFVVSIIHYPITMTRLNKAREEIDKLARS